MDARRRSLAFLVLLLSLLTPLLAQGPKLRVDAAFEPATARSGEEVTLLLTATVEDGWHAYGTKESINKPVVLKTEKLALGGLEAVGTALIPPGDLHQTPIGPSFPLPNTFVVKQKLRVPAGAAAGDVTVSGALDYQVCNETMCLPPMAAKFSVVLKVGAADAATEPSVKPGLQLEDDPKVTIAASFAPPTARAGETVTLVLDVTVDERYHAYGTKETTNSPVHLPPDKLQTGGLELAGAAQIPPGERVEKFGLEQWPLPHRFQVKQPLRVPAGTSPSKIEVKGLLDYQVCDENTCDLPAEGPFAATLVVESGEARAEWTPQSPVEPTPAPTTSLREPKYTLDDAGENALTGSWWSLVLLSIAGGLFALVMPCTYPMIPITFSFFTKQAERRGGSVLSLALMYGAGIVLMFSLIGVAVGIGTMVGRDVGGDVIDFASHWLTNLVIGAAFVVFALSLFGFFNLELPAFVTNVAGKASTTGGVAGVFLMGATLVVTSFTCTAPIVGALLAGVLEGGMVRVVAGMAVFGLTMAAPFVFLALLPSRVKALPKSGQWMNTLKISLGFVEIAAALKFISNVDLALGWQILPRETFLFAWTFVFVVLALFLFGMMGYRSVAVEGVSKTRNGFALVSLAFAFYCLFGATGIGLDPIMTAFEPPYRLRPVDEHTIVKDDYEGATSLAAREGKFLLVNFTGFT